MNRMRALFLLLTASVVLSGCNPSDLKPDFLTRSAPPTPTPAPEIVNVDP